MANGFGDAFFGLEPFGDAYDLTPVATVEATMPGDPATYDAGNSAPADAYDAGDPEREVA